MAKKAGFIKLYRSILDNPHCQFEKPYSDGEAWISLLLAANWGEVSEGEIVVERGCVLASRRTLEAWFGWCSSRVQTTLKTWRGQNMIAIRKTCRGNELRILNFDEFQASPRTSPATSPRTSPAKTKEYPLFQGTLEDLEAEASPATSPRTSPATSPLLKEEQERNTRKKSKENSEERVLESSERNLPRNQPTLRSLAAKQNSPPVADALADFPEFPCKGEPSTWRITQSKLDEWSEVFTGLNIRAEILAALQWIRDNPTSRKTASGMTRFINTWLTRSNNSPRLRVVPGGRSIESPFRKPTQDEIVAAAMQLREERLGRHSHEQEN